MAIERFSSRRQALGAVLTERLAGASRYLRIAGYFRSSLLEVVGEALETVGEIRVVCNGDLDPHDVKVAKAARDGQEALARTLVSSLAIDRGRARSTAGARALSSPARSSRVRTHEGARRAARRRQRLRARQGGRDRARGRPGLFLRRQRERLARPASATPMKFSGATMTPRAADWVRDEFEHFWAQGIDLPDAVVKHVAAMASRIEYRSIEEARDAAGGIAPEAVLAERPIYKGGQILRSWQKRFVQTCVEDHQLHGKARYLIADDVGLGKTLSMAAAALVLSLLDDKPVLILAPATLIWQWQEELEDKLGIPAAVWSTQKKCWLDGERRPLTQKRRPDVCREMPVAYRDCVDRA